MKDISRLICFAAVGVAAASWLGVLGNESEPAPPSVDPADGARSERVESARFADWLPALREGAEVTFASRPSTATDPSVPPTPFAQTATLGPLEGEDLAACIRTMEAISQARFEDLHGRSAPSDPGICYELLEQAEMLCAAEEHLAAAQALRDGDYFVTSPGRLPPPPPGAGIVQTTARQNGARVIVSIVLPFDKHRRFADAYHYKKEIWLNYPASAVDFWNRQDEAWRRDAVARAERAPGKRGGQAAASWRRRYAPGGTIVDSTTARLALVR